MEYRKQIIQAIYDAIDDVNRSLEPELMLERSPDTVLLGDGKIDSLQFLNFTVAIEESIERMFKKTISVIEAALLGAESDPLTVSALANRIENLLGFAAQPAAGVAS
jgi:acyl carrier protein